MVFLASGSSLVRSGAVLGVFALTAIPAPSQACRTLDPGVWSVAPGIENVSAQVPEDGALVVRVVCTLGTDCTGAADDAVGAVRTPQGEVVPGAWRTRTWQQASLATLAFVPTAPFARGAGYQLELEGPGADTRNFEVVAPLGTPDAHAFAASLSMGTPVWRGVEPSYQCCPADNNCGATCYPTEMHEAVTLTLQVVASQRDALLAQQIEWRAVSWEATSNEVRCVGCSQLPVLEDATPRLDYCVAVSGHLLASEVELKLGVVCTGRGNTGLQWRKTPADQVPLECRDAGTQPDSGDAGSAGEGAAFDAGTGAASDAAVDASATAHDDALSDTTEAPALETPATEATDDADVPADDASEHAAETAAPPAQAGCNVRGPAQAYVGLAPYVLALLLGLRRRPTRRLSSTPSRHAPAALARKLRRLHAWSQRRRSMHKHDQKRSPSSATQDRDAAVRAEQTAALQGKYGSGGSYGVGGGFDDNDSQDSTPQDPDGRAARAARSEAQQDDKHNGGFEREVDPDAAPPLFGRDAPRTPEEEQLAAKKRRGSRT
jgi:hypothetical protein